MMAKVYFTRECSPEKVVELYNLVGRELPGRVAVKVHSGEEGNQNFLKPEFWRPMVERVAGTVVECNTAYGGARNSTARHKELLRRHGWEQAFAVDLLDAEGPDLELPVPGGKIIQKDLVGKDLASYDSLLVLSHFKGHPMGGYGGALKQLSIGCASSDGKAYIHSGGRQATQKGLWKNICSQDEFLEAMADAARAVTDYFKDRAVFINVMANMSVDCDCCAVAEDPCLPDMGILASTDPVALDQACLDLVYACGEPGRAHFLERVESRHGVHTLEAAEQLGVGIRDYELTEV